MEKNKKFKLTQEMKNTLEKAREYGNKMMEYKDKFDELFEDSLDFSIDGDELWDCPEYAYLQDYDAVDYKAIEDYINEEFKEEFNPKEVLFSIHVETGR